MASRSLGTLTLDLLLKMGAFTQGMDQASRITDKRMREIEKRAYSFGRSIGSTLKGVGAQFLAFAGVTLTVGAAFDALKGAIDRADELRDLSIRLGTSTEILSGFGYAASQTGTDLDTLSKGMKILAKNAADALNPTSEQAKIFDALGIKVADSTGKLKDLGELVPEIADKFSQLEDGTTKAALAQALFGKSGLDLTEFLNSGAKGLDEFTKRAAELGIVIDSKTAAAADKFNDDLDDLKTAVSGLALKVAADLLPQLDHLVSEVTEFATNGDDAKNVAHDIADGFRDMVEAGKAIGQILTVLQGLRTVLNGLQDQANAVTDGIKAALTLNTDGIKDAMRRYNEASREVEAGFAGKKYDNTRGSLFQNVVSEASTKSGNPFANVRSHSDTVGLGGSTEAAIALALSNPSAPKSGKSGGKSDAKKAAEEAAKAAEEARQALADEVKAVTDAQDAFAGYAAQLAGPVAEANYQYAQDQAKLNELAKTGEISTDALTKAQANLTRAHEEDLKAIDARLNPGKQLLADIEEQTKLLAMNNDQQEIYNNLKYLGADATAQMRDSIVQATEELQAQRKATEDQIDTMDGLRDSAKVFFDDLKEGKGIWDSLKDAAANFADILYEMAERRIIEQIFGQQGTTVASSGGGSGWAGILSGIIGAFSGGGFGGEGSPLAAGGPTIPGMVHRVGEGDRPEVLLRNGKQWLLPGDRGRVIPLSGVGSNGQQFTQHNHFPVLGRTDNRSLKQVRQAAGEGAAAAIRSNGARR